MKIKLPDEVREQFVAAGSRGGKAQKKKLSKQQLSDFGKKGGKAGGRGRPKAKG